MNRYYFTHVISRSLKLDSSFRWVSNISFLTKNHFCEIQVFLTRCSTLSKSLFFHGCPTTEIWTEKRRKREREREREGEREGGEPAIYRGNCRASAKWGGNIFFLSLSRRRRSRRSQQQLEKQVCRGWTARWCELSERKKSPPTETSVDFEQKLFVLPRCDFVLGNFDFYHLMMLDDSIIYW